MSCPVGVVIPTIPSRKDFLEQRCLPAINVDETDVVVIGGVGNGSAKRNRGAAALENKYLLFVDDDCVLSDRAIPFMLHTLENNPWADFAYSDYHRVILPGVESPSPSGFFSAGPFDVRRLRASNYINTTSMIRRSVFPGWDEQFERFQDWDFWLTVVEGGGAGAYIPESLYTLYQIDPSVSSTVNPTKYTEMMIRKHRLDLGPDPKDDWKDSRGRVQPGSLNRRLAQGLG